MPDISSKTRLHKVMARFQIVRTFPSHLVLSVGQIIEDPDWFNLDLLVSQGYLKEIPVKKPVEASGDAEIEATPEQTAEEVATKPEIKPQAKPKAKK